MIKLIFLAILVSLPACVQIQDSAFNDNHYMLMVPISHDQSEYIVNEAIKVYSGSHWSVTPSLRKRIMRLRREYGFTVIDTWPLELIDEFCIVISADAESIDRMKADDRIVDVQPINHFYALRSMPPYNDAQLMAQLGPKIEVLNKLHLWATGNNIRVGLIDTAIDLDHPDLRSRNITQGIFVKEDLNDQDKGHGTAIAGIISAEGNNSIGVVGYAPDVKLLSYAACYFREQWNRTVCNTFALAKALAATVDDDVHIINLSLAGPRDPVIERLINKIIQRDVIVVAAENYSSSGLKSLRFPASMPEVVGVSTLSDPRVLLPVIIKAEDEHLTTRTGGDYQYFYGSSMSTARVTAMISLLLERYPSLSGPEVRRLLAGASNECETEPEGYLCLVALTYASGSTYFRQGAKWQPE
jgi:hypothetical protein